MNTLNLPVLDIQVLSPSVLTDVICNNLRLKKNKRGIYLSVLKGSKPYEKQIENGSEWGFGCRKNSLMTLGN